MTVVDTDNNRIRSTIRIWVVHACRRAYEQARREWESELQHVNSLQTLLYRQGEKVGHELITVSITR